jgi:hypothetical protein
MLMVLTLIVMTYQRPNVSEEIRRCSGPVVCGMDRSAEGCSLDQLPACPCSKLFRHPGVQHRYSLGEKLRRNDSKMKINKNKLRGP